MSSGAVALAVEAYRALERAQRRVADRERDLKMALARLNENDLPDYVRATQSEA